MAKIFVVMETYFNGEGDANRPVCAFTDEAAAETFTGMMGSDFSMSPTSSWTRSQPFG